MGNKPSAQSETRQRSNSVVHGSLAMNPGRTRRNASTSEGIVEDGLDNLQLGDDHLAGSSHSNNLTMTVPMFCLDNNGLRRLNAGRNSINTMLRMIAANNELNCPFCQLKISRSQFDKHLEDCCPIQRMQYNDDILTEDKGECAICFDELAIGNTIARLPCLCIYHKDCIDKWLGIKNTCPEHPGYD
uniref:RING-type domain-containing protein n=1 Tax=Rhabditophanes sp. KR3021 TaxID=114890 RepID=A0AC35UCJ4_9BILA